MATKRRSFNKIQQAPKRQSLRERRRNQRYLLISLSFIILASVVFGASKFSRTESFQISSINVIGAVIGDKKGIEGAILDSVDGNYLSIFSKAMTYIIPRDSIKANVLSSFPVVKDVQIDVVGKDAIDVIVSEREPFALMCAELDTTDQCYIADIDGFVYKKLENDEKEKLSDSMIKIILPGISDKDIAVTPIETDRFIALVNFLNDAKSNGIDAYAVTESLGREHTMYVNNSFGNITKIHFNERETLGRQIENLILFYKESNEESDYEYIDLRFGNNIVYKERHEDSI